MRAHDQLGPLVPAPGRQLERRLGASAARQVEGARRVQMHGRVGVSVLEALRFRIRGRLGHVQLRRRSRRSCAAYRLMYDRRVDRARRSRVEEGRRGRYLRPFHAYRRLSWQRRQHVLGADHGLAAYAEFIAYSLELRLQNVILLAELHHALLEHHVVETPLLSRSFGRLVVTPSAVPVAVVLLVVRDELPLLALGK